MDTNEIREPPGEGAGVCLSIDAQRYLKEAGRWTGFLGIVGFIVCGFLLIAAIFLGTIFSILSNFYMVFSQMPAWTATFFSVILILADVVYFFLALYLCQFAARIKRGFAFTDARRVTEAFGRLKSFFKLWGIVTIVVLCVCALEIATFVMMAAASS